MHTIQAILEQLKEHNVKEVSKDLAISDKRLRAALQAAGYQYSQSTRVWDYIGEGPEPLNRELMEFMPTGSPQAAKTALDSRQKTDTTTPMDSLTADEIAAIRSLLAAHKQQEGVIEAAATALEQHTDSTNSIEQLIMRTRTEIQPEKKTRKSVYFNESISTKLDQFSATYRIQKQDVIELALRDFFKRYGYKA
ncbi:hypothetical protein [Ectobacillus panaciterrae]|uniref:hypothetical protein n=1 Tax=Ectobacillus panaciterrae TaxID=363872 RepID=UPI00042A2067|nr:hypothetical protein [Ectobacillus panaciterrae]